MKNSNTELFINIGNIQLNNVGISIIDLNKLNEIFENYSNKSIKNEIKLKDSDVYYILYTSGSTGKPKGVQITYKCLQSFIDWFTPYCNMNSKEPVFLNQVSYSFDVSIISTYIGLVLCDTLFVIDKTMISDYKSLFENFKKSKLSFWVSTPSFAEMCLIDKNFNKEIMPKLEKMFFAGEILSNSLILKLKERFGDISIINGYGPTEATVLVTAVEINSEIFNKYDSIPIGYPIDSCELYLIDENGNKVIQDSEKGELYIKGPSVSIGYYNNDSMTQKNFIIDKDNIMIYKTGDLAYKKDKMFFYCGRKDFQIKLNGFRIELEDIENNLKNVSIVNSAVVIPMYKDYRISHLKAYVTLNTKLNDKEFKIVYSIKDELKKLIPEYMIPRNIKIMDNLPINTNGKIDRKLLMEENR